MWVVDVSFCPKYTSWYSNKYRAYTLYTFSNDLSSSNRQIHQFKRVVIFFFAIHTFISYIINKTCVIWHKNWIQEYFKYQNRNHFWKNSSVWMSDIRLKVEEWPLQNERSPTHVIKYYKAVFRIRIIWQDPDPLKKMLIRIRVAKKTNIKINQNYKNIIFFLNHWFCLIYVNNKLIGKVSYNKKNIVMSFIHLQKNI